MTGCMLTPDELTALEGLLTRARRDAARDRSATLDPITPGDVLQLRPGASRTWETSLLLTMQADAHQVRAQVLRPHRSGCREAWASFSPAEVARIGRAPFPEPAPDVKSACYAPPCPKLATPAQIARYRKMHDATWKRLQAERVFIAEADARRRKKAP
jgi:hypothetical protein